MRSHPFSDHSSYITGAAVGGAEGWLVMAIDGFVEQDISNAVFLSLKDTELELRHAGDFKTRFCGLLPNTGGDLIAVGEYDEVVVISETGSTSIDAINAGAATLSVKNSDMGVIPKLGGCDHEALLASCLK